MQDYVNTFRASYRRALGDGSYNIDFIERFYEKFISHSDQVKALFRDTDMGLQKTMLHDSLEFMVEFFVTRRSNPHMEHIAQVHGPGGKDVPMELYDLWLNCLIEAVRETDPEFSKSTEVAWRLVLTPGIAYMKMTHGGSGEKSN